MASVLLRLLAASLAFTLTGCTAGLGAGAAVVGLGGGEGQDQRAERRLVEPLRHRRADHHAQRRQVVVGDPPEERELARVEGRQRVEHHDAPVHVEQTFDDALGGVGLTPALLAENGNIRLQGRIGDRMSRHAASRCAAKPISRRLISPLLDR